MEDMTVLDQAIEVIEFIAGESEAVSLARMVENCAPPGENYPAIVAKLTESQWLLKRGEDRYEISPALLTLVRRAVSNLDKYKAVEPRLAKLADEIGYPLCLSVREGREQLIALVIPVAYDATPIPEVGTRVPLLAGGAIGVVMAAGLGIGEFDEMLPSIPGRLAMRSKIGTMRAQGYCYVAANEDGRRVDTLSVPVANAAGEEVAALTAVSAPGGLAKTDFKALSRKMQKAAEEISL